jgi:G3E family GTPase
MDLIDESALSHLKDRISSMNAIAPLLVAQRAQIPLDFILDINAYDLNVPMTREKITQLQLSRHQMDSVRTRLRFLCSFFMITDD